MSALIDSIVVETIEDDSPDASYLQQDEFANRLASYQRGEFDYIGIQATATIRVTLGMPHGYTYEITSPGLWGIESDSGRAYFVEVAHEEMSTLADILAELSIDQDAVKREIEHAVFRF